MKSRVLVLVLAFALMLSCMAGLARRADANFIGVLEGLPSIIIQSDGSVVPQTEYITREGNVYKLTSDLQQTYIININCSNIVFDGQGHVINGSGNVFWTNDWYGYYCEGITVENQVNVTIKNVIVTGFEKPAIYVYNSSEISISKVQTELLRFWSSNNSVISACKTPLSVSSSYNNIVSESTLWLALTFCRDNLIYMNDIRSVITFSSSADNVLYMNNISSARIASYSADFWDNGSFGNYWDDYLDKHPNASEIGVTGIANMPYIINENNVDNYPLMRPVSTEQETDATPFPLTLFAGVSTVLIAGATAGFVYQKKHGSRQKSDNRLAE